MEMYLNKHFVNVYKLEILKNIHVIILIDRKVKKKILNLKKSYM